MFGLFIKLMNRLKFFEFFVSKTIVNKRTYDKWLAFEPLVIVLFTLSLSGTKYIYYI